MPARPAPNYLDLLAPDGTVDRAVFDAILQSRIAAEINLRLCVAAGLFAPHCLPLGEARAWRAQEARRLDRALVPPAERARIACQERSALEDWVAAMRAGATRQREAMGDPGGEALQAAE
jgi:hypothetical protein